MSNTYTSIQDLFIERNDISSSADAGFLSMLCKGYIHTAQASSYLLLEASSYLLLYTISGHGNVSSEKQSLSLTKDTLLFLPASKGIRISSSTASWHFFACLISGSSMYTYYDCYKKADVNPYTIPIYSGIPSYIEKLHLCNSNVKMIYTMTISKLLHDLLTELCVDTHASDVLDEHLPDYLLNLKSIFDTAYQQPFSLSEYESRYGISKYRLCREFSNYFHASPLQYLNSRRIEVAKDLLLSTSMSVHEVGSAVGIDNTNHFINLFKKNTGATPLTYKQEAPASIRALHYPYRPDDPPQ